MVILVICFGKFFESLGINAVLDLHYRIIEKLCGGGVGMLAESLLSR